MKKFLLMLSILPLALMAAGTSPDVTAQYLTKATTTKLSVQQPTTGAKVVVFDYVFIECSSAATATLSFDGTAATVQALIPTPLNESPTATAKAYSASNVGAGTTIDTYTVPGSSVPYGIDLAAFYMDNDGTAHNFTVATTASCKITIKHREFAGVAPPAN